MYGSGLFRLQEGAIYGTIEYVRIIRLPDFVAWFESLSVKGQLQVDARILRVQEHGHFGDVRNLGDGLAEMKWKNGWRVYFGYLKVDADEAVLLVLGGNKNGQEKDIKKARVLLERFTTDASQARG